MGRYQTDSAALGQPLYDFIGKKGGEWLGKVTNKPGLGQKLGGLFGQTLGKYEVNTTRREEFLNRGNRAFGNVGNKKGGKKPPPLTYINPMTAQKPPPRDQKPVRYKPPPAEMTTFKPWGAAAVRGGKGPVIVNNRPN